MSRIYIKEFGIEVRCQLSSHLIINQSSIDLFANTEVIFDTGADITVFPASEIGLGVVLEQDFTKYLQTGSSIETIQKGKVNPNTLIATSVIGINADAERIKVYLLQIDSFKIKADSIIDFKSIPIFVTFDKSFKSPILGSDIMSLISYTIDHDNNILDIDFTAKYHAYMNSHKRIDAMYYARQGFYDDNFLVNTNKKGYPLGDIESF